MYFVVFNFTNIPDKIIKGSNDGTIAINHNSSPSFAPSLTTDGIIVNKIIIPTVITINNFLFMIHLFKMICLHYKSIHLYQYHTITLSVYKSVHYILLSAKP